MSSVTACPARERLEQFCLGALDDKTTAALEQHLAACPACLRIAQELLSNDTFVENVRSRSGTAGQRQNDLYSQLTQRLRKLAPGGIEPTLTCSTSAGSGTIPVIGSTSSGQDLSWVLSPPQGPDELGRLSGYRVLRVLGQGGMGLVLEAVDVGLQRRVALKVMKLSISEDGLAKERFLREARTAARVRCDHVVTIYQVGEDRSIPFLAMEILDGEALDDRLKKSGQSSLKETLRVGREIALGLAAAHEQGLIHRDIKPGNVWIEPSGRAKILDFGLARPVERNAHLTSSGTIVGTPAYMAPEQARGEKVDARADLFSLGCVLYRLCTGAMPFKGDTAMDVLVALATQTPQAVAELSPQSPPALAALIHRLLEKDREKRPASAREVVEALQTIEEQQQRTTPQQPPASRRKLLVAAAIGFLALLAAGIVFFLQTPRATIRIEIDDPMIEVVLTQTGATIKGAGSHEIKLEAGEYGFTVKRGDLQFETDRIVLKKGETVMLKIVFLQGKVQVAMADGKVIGSKDIPETGGSPVAPAGTDFALQFDGSALVELPGAGVDSSGPYTWEYYASDVTPPKVGKNETAFCIQYGAKTPHMGVATLTGNPGHWFFRPNFGAKVDGRPVNWTASQHVAGVFTDSEALLFVNGKLMSRKPLTREPPSRERHKLNLGRYFVGTLDEIRISKTARYDKDFTPKPRFEPDADTVALYHCDEGNGNVLKDSSRNRHDGKILGAKWVKAGPSWTPLFNGKDLTGWSGRGGTGNWKVANGAITCSGAMDYLYTDRDDLGDFHLRAEVKINAQGNSGIYFRCAKPVVLVGDYEAQICTRADQQKTGSLYNLAKFSEVLVAPDTWFTLEIIAEGKRLQILVNGKQTADYEETNKSRRDKGRIALQHHDAMTEVHFRKIQFVELNTLPPVGSK